MEKIYQPEVVNALEKFYGILLSHKGFETVAAHLEALAVKMYEGAQQHKPCVLAEMSNYHPSFLGATFTRLKTATFSLEDCQLTTAKQYGFFNWKDVEKLAIPYNHDFEDAVDYLVNGQLDKLKQLLHENDTLVKAYSSYGHNASLLHYAGSNGVEMWRQKVPYNLAQIITVLLAQGADRNAKMKVYGGEHTVLELLKTSAHPKNSNYFPLIERAFNIK